MYKQPNTFCGVECATWLKFDNIVHNTCDQSDTQLNVPNTLNFTTLYTTPPVFSQLGGPLTEGTRLSPLASTFKPFNEVGQRTVPAGPSTSGRGESTIDYVTAALLAQHNDKVATMIVQNQGIEPVILDKGYVMGYAHSTNVMTSLEGEDDKLRPSVKAIQASARMDVHF